MLPEKVRLYGLNLASHNKILFSVFISSLSCQKCIIQSRLSTYAWNWESGESVIYSYILVPPNLIENDHNFVFFGYKVTIQQHFKSRLFWKTKYQEAENLHKSYILWFSACQIFSRVKSRIALDPLWGVLIPELCT